MCGFTERNRKTAMWTSKNKTIEDFNKNVPSAKVADLEPYKSRVRFVLKNLPSVFAFYSANRFKRLRWSVYMKRQKTYHELIREVTNGDKNTIVAYGDSSFSSSSKGTAPTPTTTLRRKLGQNAIVVDVDEYNTSKLCSSCHQAMEGMRVKSDADGSLKTLYTVRRCQTVTHCILWNRDVNAAINILNLYLAEAGGQSRPAAFCRPQTNAVAKTAAS
jgi:hypothetical protein